MKFAIVASLVMTSALTNIALAQDGNGHGPPKRSSVVFLSQQTTAAQSESLSQLFKAKSILATSK